MDRTVDAAAPAHPAIRGVDDGIHLLGRDVSLHHRDLHPVPPFPPTCQNVRTP
jgi:hypothetical protein